MNLEQLNDTPPWDWPSDAGKIIVDALQNKSLPVSQRELAASFAGNEVVMEEEIALLLLSIICDNSEAEAVRCQAAISLGPALEYGATVGTAPKHDEAHNLTSDHDDDDEQDIDDDMMLTQEVFEEVKDRLKEYYFNTGFPKAVRRSIFEASVRAPMEWHKKEIETAYASQDPEWVITAVFAMGYVRGFETQILESLKNKNEDIFYEAVCAAGYWELEEAWPCIQKLLKDAKTEKWLRIAAIEAASTINPDAAIDILEELALSSDEDIAEAAEGALSVAKIEIDDEWDDDDDDDYEEDDDDDDDDYDEDDEDNDYDDDDDDDEEEEPKRKRR